MNTKEKEMLAILKRGGEFGYLGVKAEGTRTDVQKRLALMNG
jgi:hypothetical protein